MGRFSSVKGDMTRSLRQYFNIIIVLKMKTTGGGAVNRKAGRQSRRLYIVVHER